MLNSKLYFFCLYRCCAYFLIVVNLCIFSAYSIDKTTLRVLSLFKDENYSAAVDLMEKEIRTIRDKSKKGYYALLLNQLPVNISMKRARYEYAFMAALWAKDIPRKKRISLWIEAGDGFFKSGNLKKANLCYKEALSYVKEGQFEFTYILHKQAWIYINQKEWVKAFGLFTQAIRKKSDHLRSIILFDMGKVWVESQYFKNQIPSNVLLKNFQSVSEKEKQFIIEGIVQGINRTEKQDIDVVVTSLSVNRGLFTRILNYILSDTVEIVIPPCRLLPWLRKVQIKEVSEKQALSVMNSCTYSLLSIKKKNKLHKKQLRYLVDLYVKFKRVGFERWPLAVVYDKIKRKTEACNESLRMLIEVLGLMDEHVEETDIQKPFIEVFRLCKGTKGQPRLIMETTKTVFSSDVLVRKYRNTKESWENALFNLLDLKVFRFAVRKNILKAKTEWRGKDLLPALLLSHVSVYHLKEIRAFFDRFGLRPINNYYLEILIDRREDLDMNLLQKWLPVSDVNSYLKILPWLEKALSDELNESQETVVVEKLLQYFPSTGKERRAASLFVALHYLKMDQVSKVFKHWEKISSVFNKGSLAVELFEKSLYNEGICENFKSFKISSEIKRMPLLGFTYQCCQILESEKYLKGVRNLAVPSLLLSSSLAWDFVLLVRIQKRTIWLERGISQLHNSTSKMITDLKKTISRYRKRKWLLKAMSKKVDSLLKKQIDFFENELTKLSQSSPYGKKYEELKNIVIQWR